METDVNFDGLSNKEIIKYKFDSLNNMYSSLLELTKITEKLYCENRLKVNISPIVADHNIDLLREHIQHILTQHSNYIKSRNKCRELIGGEENEKILRELVEVEYSSKSNFEDILCDECCKKLEKFL